MVQPKKHLGQHFLTDPAIAERIVELLPAEQDMTVMEIGPGTGVLTRFLVQKPFKKYVLVEVDNESVAFLHNQYPQLRESLLHADFLKMDDRLFREAPQHIIGNFPYNISSQIFFKILGHRNMVNSVVCMLQKEVADRIAAPPGSKTYGILSVLLQAFYDITYRFSVKPGSFYPPPRVNSAVITLTRNQTSTLGCDEKLFFRVVKTTFNQRRKTIRNSLKTILLTLGDENELLSKRPEQLGVGEFVELTNFVTSRM
jgi:16S rRNA (adenine1518-N6/adenine1519-N6)-dimethyltransferase